MRTKLARFVWHVAFGVGLCATTAAVAPAQDYRYVPQGPVYVKPNCAAPSLPAPGIPAMPSVPSTAPGTTPATTPGTTPGTTPATTPGTTPGTTPNAAEAQAAMGDTGAAAAAAAGAEAGLGATGTSSSAGMLGRGDADNRFNLFDNNSAIPTNRVFFNYELMQKFNTGLTVNPRTAPPGTPEFATIRSVDLYRVGGEIALGSRCSISFQDQYIASEDTPDNADAWGDPEFLLKYAFCLQEHAAMAATFGVQPQVSSSPFELHEKDTRFLPGLLLYKECDRLFVQGGTQFGFSSRNVATTFDWAISAGYWLCRSDSSAGNHRWITGIAPQVEVYGAHVLVGSRNDPYDLPQGLNDQNVTFREDRNVIDVTAGGRILLMDKVNVSTAVSFPVTGGDVRRTEFLTGLNILF